MSHRGLGMVVLAGSLLALGCSTHIGTVSADGDSYRSDSSTVQVMSGVVGNKNVFIPSTIVIAGDAPVTLSVYNGTEGPHGFAIAGLGIEEVLQAQQEQEIEIPATEGGHIYRIHCHLHAAHRTATLVVLPGE